MTLPPQRNILAALIALGLLIFAAPGAHAQDPAMQKTAADTAFAAADYAKAIALYQAVLPTLPPDEAQAVAERIRFARRQIELARLASTQPTTRPALQPTTQPTTAPARTPHTPPKPGETRELTLHELGNFEFSEDDDAHIPDDVQKLDGLKVKIPGQMLPIDQSGKVTRFLLVNDLMSCCYGTTPKLQNIALVTLPKGKWIAPTSERLIIEGTLSVGIKKDQGFIVCLYEIQPVSIKFAAQ